MLGIRSVHVKVKPLFPYFGRRWRLLTATLLVTLAVTVVGVATPLVTRVVVDEVLIAQQRSPVVWLSALLGAGVLLYLLNALRRYWSGRLALDIQHDLRTDFFSSVLKFGSENHKATSKGQIFSRATNDLQIVLGALFVVPTLIGSVATLALATGVMVNLSPLLAMIVLGTIPPIWALGAAGARTLFPAGWSAQREAAELTDVINDQVEGALVVRSFGNEAHESYRFRAQARRLYAARLRVVQLTARHIPISQTVPLLGYIAILGVGGAMVLSQRLSPGTLISFISYLALVVAPAQSLLGMVGLASQAVAGVDRLFEVIGPSYPQRPFVPSPHPTSPISRSLDVTFEGVTMLTERGSRLNDFSLACPAGATVALVGPTGAGKSSALTALLHPEAIAAGAIRIGGRDTRQLSRTQLTQAVVIVRSTPFIVPGTVLDNILMGRPDAKPEEVYAAARAAACHEFITELPLEYREVIGPGGRQLSGGQRQRIALARAFLANPPVLVLDDATSALDALTEHQILTALRELPGKRTLLLATHRDSVLELADTVAVVEGGRVTWHGDKAAASRQSPAYRLLFTAATPQDPGSEASVTDARWPYASQAPSNDTSAGDERMRSGVAGLVLAPQMRARLEKLKPITTTPAQHAVDTRSPLSLANLGRSYLIPMLCICFFALADAAFTAAVPMILRRGLPSNAVNVSQVALTVAVAGGCGLALAQTQTRWALTRLAGATTERMMYAVRVRVFAGLQRQRMAFFEERPPGVIMSRVTTDIEAVSAVAQSGIAWSVTTLCTVVALLAAMLLIDPLLALPPLVGLLTLLMASMRMAHHTLPQYHDAREAMTNVADYLHSCLGIIGELREWRWEAVTAQRHTELSQEFRDKRLRVQAGLALYYPCGQLLSTASLVTVFALCPSSDSGHLAATLAAFIMCVDLLFAPAQQAAQALDSIQQAKVSMARLAALAADGPTSSPRTFPSDQEPHLPVPAQGRLSLEPNLELRNLTFSYPSPTNAHRRPAIDDVSLRITKPSIVAVVGESGSGKSTLLKLISGIYSPHGGSVEISGSDLVGMSRSTLRRAVSVVPQDAYLLGDTVRDAISYGRKTAGADDIEAVARAVGAHAAVAHLDHGYLSPVYAGGSNLSAGQRQLISLARGYLTQPSVLLLDETTAALDGASERAVTWSLKKIAENSIVLVVAHRLSTAAAADRIVVFSQGQIVEDGTHEALLARRGTYARMWGSTTA